MEKYEQIRVIERGSSGQVWLIQRKSDNEYFVMKEIDVDVLEENEKFSALNEIRILSKVNHPNIIQMHEYFEMESKLCLVLDFCEGGDMATLIKSARGHMFSQHQIIDWFVQICLAVKHLHERNILHRDLKTGNIFLTKNRHIVKLGDFGVAKKLIASNVFASTSVGSL
jgi:NIMA (never in mitosis gene a)-related kinase